MKTVLGSRRARALLVAAAVIAFGAAAIAVPAQQQREVRRSFAAASGMEVDLENLAGAVTVEGTGGSQLEVVATVHAADGGGADAEELLDLLDITFDESAGRLVVRAEYPVERFDRFRYPGRGGRNFNTQTTYQRERVTVTSRNDRDAVTLYVDFALRVPAGVSVDIDNNVGDVGAAGLEGDLRADTGSGRVSARSIIGDVYVDTGSGDVEVDDVTGNVTADTGSGEVLINNVRGDVSADTGSGDVRLTGVEARRIEADTGSGDVMLERVSGDISADTGSGDIIGRNVVSGASISADTGSGDVLFEGDLSGARQIEIDTSSGDVVLELSAYPGMAITIETGSGNIDVDLPDLSAVRSRRNYFRGTVGDGAAAVTIDTGSGSVRIRQR